ncbi:RHS repeat-associated core domain-containing protein [Flavobacterium phragmitis]|uniref:RHS repeat-associated core domain-containing protein n=1 Tax=Flavobacterium phragmitis TaxID=739143 RepID=A0A1I1SLR7_9FLAO|nr:RHS repeat-associated core domain-containing protein [Flavobacterium phragmitis]SFD47396.1 RHS repeat-associated core domain-containing protein [Flavobacterium phragmitis]
MKKFYLFILVLVTPYIYSQNFTDTKGELQISSSGTAVYTLPIAVPPSIKSVAPIINLVYNSGVRGGIAGQGWSINSISAISRIATRRDIDGFVDGVDFDDNDKLALDGQRLLIKTGTYWASGSTYETEYKSNTKIELKIEGAIMYFIVTAPDGSRSWYGSKGAGSLQNSVSLNSWHIVHYEDVNENFIDYNYKTVAYNNTNQLYIDTITFSGNNSTGIAAQNKIAFNYRNAKRIERDYLKGQAVYATQILDNIKVYASNSLFRTYQLKHYEDVKLGYERVKSIQEINAQMEESNPVTFTYASSPANEERIEKTYVNNLAFDKVDIAGDFDGDGRLDFVADKKIFTNLFTGNTGNSGINFPTIRPTLIFPATIKQNYKINQFHSIIEPVASNSQIQFIAYNIVDSNLNYTGLTSSTVQTITFDNTIFIDPSYKDEDENYVPPVAPPQDSRNNEYLSGDFDGDGISEVLILSKDERLVWEVYINSSGYSEGGYWRLYSNTNSDYRREARLAYLSTGASTVLQGDSYYICATGKRYVADLNGDGKSDIININQHGQYSIVEINKSPSGAIEVNRIGYGTLSNYSHTKQILFGDFNGDGKTDIMLPTSEGGEGQTEWNIYYANPKPAGGDFFFKETLNIVEYRPDTGSDYNTQRHWSNYYAIDINGDGKSDLVRVWRKYFKASWTINNHDTQWRVTGFTNNIGKTDASGFPLTYDSGTYESGSPDIPIPIVSNYKYDGANSELVVVRGHYNKIEYYQFNKNLDTDNRLVTVTESNGNIKQTIEYKPMQAEGASLGNASTDFYSSENAVTYPNIEIIRNSDSYLVSKLTATINGVSKYQDFRYRGFVSNFVYGTVGFTHTTRSSWYLSSSDSKIWTTQYNDANYRGANTIIWSSTDANTVFSDTPSNLLSTKTNIFDSYTNPISKVYNILLRSQTAIDHLTNVKTETTFTYDGTVQSSNYYGLEAQSITKNFSGAALQGTITVDTQYENNPSGTGSSYYVGRPKKVNSSSTIYTGDTRTSEEVYSYSGANLTKTEKKGTGTYAIIEDMTYDALGNLLTKTVSAPGAPTPPASRTITDEYDATKRFVIKKTDHQGFVTNFVYNTLGQVTQSTDYLGVVNSYTYDNWGKLITTATQNTASTSLTSSIVYAKLSNGGYTTTTTNNTDGKTITQYDVLGRAVITSTKGFAANSMVSKQIVYDGLGRKTKESQPYFTSPSQWTAYEYDYLMRPVKVTAHTGKIQTLSYSGLTTTSNDDGKITTITVDALGNKTQTTDPGGAINFVYYANGQLKESDYQGNKVTISIDGWGNKIAMTDPSSGTYTYSYDAFGQIKTETTPNGTTSYEYDAAGKTTQKTIIGTNTNSKTTYAYNAFNLVTSSSFVNNLEGNAITNTFEYDGYKRISKTTESTPYAVFTKELAYDTYGRALTETSTATISGKSSSKKVKHTYTNGYAWQILDDATQQVLWQTNSLNERGQLTGASVGNGVAISNTYDQYGYASQFKFDRTVTNPGNVMTLTTTFEPKRGNLTNRTNNLFSWNESFTYDGLDRLLTYKNALGQQQTQSYDDKGRITQNNVGTYDYTVTGKTYQNNSITLSPDALNYYKNRGGVSSTEEIFSDGMEEKTGWGTEKYPNTNFHTYSIGGAHGGQVSLKLDNKTTSKYYVYSDKWIDINNTVDTQYILSAWIFTYSGQSEIGVYAKNECGTNDYIQLDNVGGESEMKWSKISKTILIPAYTKKIKIRLDSNYGTVWFDDVQINKANLDSPTTDVSEVFNDGTESQTGWGTEKHPNTNFHSYSIGGAHGGQVSLKIDNKTTSKCYVYSDKWININNTTDTKYTLSAWIFTYNGQGSIGLYTKNECGTGDYIQVDNVGGESEMKWSKISKTILVPASTKRLKVRLDSNYGTVWFDDIKVDRTDPLPPTGNTQMITYNTFKSPVQIEETGVDKISFTYNDGNDRSSMFYGSLDNEKLLRPYRKHYSADGSMEIKQNIITGETEFLTYIGGDGYSAPVVLKSNGTAQNYLYLHRDYQGTIVAISDQNGAVVEKRLFDAWGSIIKVEDGSGNALSGLTVLDRGYTGHEHLQSIGIINMNGRLYDPKLHRFLQPDNYVQEPYNTQNYNKYAYVLNNPLKYTDPSGEVIIGFAGAVIIGATIAALTYTITALVADVPFTVGGLVKATFVGAASSAVTYGIGSAAGSLFTNFYSQAAFQAVAHGTFQGGMTAISGGKFWSGFAAGALSSIASSAWGGGMSTETVDGVTTETIHQGLSGATGMVNGFGTIAFGTVSGGVGAQLTGGNFWQGAATGLVVSGLNHAMHKIQGNQLDKEVNETFKENADNKAPVTAEALEEVLNLPVLRKWASRSGNPKTYYSKEMYAKDGQSEALTELSLVDHKSSTITYYAASFSSYRNLAQTVLHELGHARFNYLGFRWAVAQKYGDRTGWAVSEFYAYKFAYMIGRVPYASYVNYAIGAAYVHGMPSYSELGLIKK